MIFKKSKRALRKFGRMMHEVTLSINDIIFFENIVDSVMIFLLIFVVLYMLMLYPIVALIPAFLYLIAASWYKFRKDKLLRIERLFPFMKEKLRTAVDVVSDEENPMISLLHHEVIKDMKKVVLSNFFNMKSTSLKMIAIVVLCFGILLAASFNIRVDSIGLVKNAIKNSPIKFKSNPEDKPYALVAFDEDIVSYQGTDADYSGGRGQIGSEGSETVNEDIFGGKSIAKLGNKELDIEITPISFEVNFNEVRQREVFDFDTFYYETAVYEDPVGEKSREQQEIIKKYFKKLGEG